MIAAAGGAPGIAQEATPEAAVGDAAAVSHGGETMLFVQSFRSGSIAPIDGIDGRYLLTLEEGLGETIYFSDRPERLVGATPTQDFLPALGFLDENPPNAALVVQTSETETDIAVLELFSPTYDVESHTATYEVEVLKSWQAEMGIGFAEAPVDLAALAPTFGGAQLFIDDCPDHDTSCYGPTGHLVGTIPASENGGYCYNWGQIACVPCLPDKGLNTGIAYMKQMCNDRFSDCNGNCTFGPVCFGAGC